MHYAEYRRRIFNTVLLECLSRIHEQCYRGEGMTDDEICKAGSQMANAFFVDSLNLSVNTIHTTKKKLSESVTFIKDCVELSEAIASEKADLAAKEDLVIGDNQPIEVSPEDKEVIDVLFDNKNPEAQVQAVRDATVKALVVEDQRSQQIRDSIAIAQQQSVDNPEALDEAINRLSTVGPTGLMNAILNTVSSIHIEKVNESTTVPMAIGDIIKENADKIKTDATMIYTLHEMSSVFGITKYTPQYVERLANDIYHERRK